MDKKEFKQFIISEAKKFILEEEKKCTETEEELSEDDKPKAIKDKPRTPKVKTVPKTPEDKKTKKDKVKDTKKKPKSPKPPKTKKVDEGITPSEISQLAEEIKKLNKKLDFRNPLISENTDSIVGSVLSESENKRMKNLYKYIVITDND